MEIIEATPWEYKHCDLSCSAPGHSQVCRCEKCMGIYEQRKAIRQCEIRAIEARLGGGFGRGRNMSLVFMGLLCLFMATLLIARVLF